MPAKDKYRKKKVNEELASRGSAEDRRRQFAELYCLLGNATEAARQLGYKVPYQKGYELMQRADVKAMIEEIMPRVKAEITKATQDTRESLAWKIAAIANTNITDIVNLVKKEIKSIDANGNEHFEVYYQLEFKPFSELTEEQKYAIKAVEMTKYGPKITMYDKTWSLDMIARTVGYISGNDENLKVPRGVVIMVPDNGRKNSFKDNQEIQNIDYLEEIIEATIANNTEDETNNAYTP